MIAGITRLGATMPKLWPNQGSKGAAESLTAFQDIARLTVELYQTTFKVDWPANEPKPTPSSVSPRGMRCAHTYQNTAAGVIGHS